jgi:hypothetical protein
MRDPLVLGVEVVEGIAKVRLKGRNRLSQAAGSPSFLAGMRACCVDNDLKARVPHTPKHTLNTHQNTLPPPKKQVGTPIAVPTKGGLELGRIASMELNHKSVDTVRCGRYSSAFDRRLTRRFQDPESPTLRHSSIRKTPTTRPTQCRPLNIDPSTHHTTLPSMHNTNPPGRATAWR